MRSIRLVSRLDIKGPNLIKGIKLEGLRVIGNPYDFAKKYYQEGIDEIIYIDIVASLYGRNSLTDLVERTAKDVFVPITVGGGIRSVEDALKLFKAGADKVAINTAAVQNPRLIEDLAQRFGSQAVVLSIEANKNGVNYEAYTDNGRNHTGLNVFDWVVEGEKLGAGEILLTAVDQEGTGKGFDVELITQVTKRVNIPVIASGGMGNLKHFSEAIFNGGADAVAMANVLHYNRLPIEQIRTYALENNINVRKYD